MRMLRRYLRLELDEIDRQKIQFRTIGRTGVLADNVKREIAKATERTEKNPGMVLTVALNYGGRTEIVDACRAAVRRLVAEGNPPDEITEERIADELYTRKLPDLDLLARFTLLKHSGRTFDEFTCWKRSLTTNAAIVALADCNWSSATNSLKSQVSSLKFGIRYQL